MHALRPTTPALNPLHVYADLAGRIRNQLRSRAAEAEQAYWLASEAFIAARLARAAALAAQRAARQVCWVPARSCEACPLKTDLLQASSTYTFALPEMLSWRCDTNDPTVVLNSNHH